MGSGRLPTPTCSWAASPWVSLAPGPDLEGSRTVAASTPIRISVSLDRGPQATRHGMGGCDWRTSELKHEPEEIPDAEHELVIERVAAVDVAKASGKVCVRVPGKAGRRVSRVWDVAATTAAVTELAEDLVELGSRGSPSSRRRTTGGSGTTCWRRPGSRCSWSTPAT